MAAFELAYEARGLWVPHVGWSDSFEGVDNAAVAAALPSLLTRRTDEFLSSKRSSALRPRGTRGQQQPVTARLDWKSSTEEAGSTRYRREGAKSPREQPSIGFWRTSTGHKAARTRETTQVWRRMGSSRM
mmetsp:Transcript_33681/g.80566  ORF Transcript_33681/g.80566 Transcript_33681/m.80566 type:complete len:130 (+) Transcript_33681:241-630(+)